MKECETIHVAMAADGPYQKGLDFARESMLRSCSDPSRLQFHVFGDDAALSARIRREFGTYKGSTMAFVRLYLAELLPDVDWVVYSDVDTVWHRDVSRLWELRDESRSVMWVADLPSTREEASEWQRAINPAFDRRRYGCSGVMLVNLKWMRETGFLDRAIAFTKANGLLRYVDQDILNALCHDTCGLLPECWDVLVPNPANTRGGAVFHLTGVGRCFCADYGGSVVQYRWWEHLARGRPFNCRLPLPFPVPDWLVRVAFPFAGAFFRDRVRRWLGWHWYLSRVEGA